MRNHRVCWCAVLWLLVAGDGGAVPFQDFQVWTNVTATGSLVRLSPTMERLHYWIEMQGRFGNDSTTLSQGIIRPGLGYSLTPHASVWVGYAYVPTMEPFASNDRNEQRVWEQLVWSIGAGLGTLNTRTRLEQRFRPPGSDVGWRFREQLKLTWPFIEAPAFSIVVSDEIFINLNRPSWTTEGFNQNRFFIGFAYFLDQHVKTEIGYLNQFQNRDGAPNELHHILALAVQVND